MKRKQVIILLVTAMMLSMSACGKVPPKESLQVLNEARESQGVEDSQRGVILTSYEYTLGDNAFSHIKAKQPLQSGIMKFETPWEHDDVVCVRYSEELYMLCFWYNDYTLTFVIEEVDGEMVVPSIYYNPRQQDWVDYFRVEYADGYSEAYSYSRNEGFKRISNEEYIGGDEVTFNFRQWHYEEQGDDEL